MKDTKYLHSEPSIGARVFIDDTAWVNGSVTLASDVSIWPMAVLRGDMQSITVGARTNVQDGTVIHVTHAGEFTGAGQPVVIGEEVTIGHQSMLHGCSIGDRVLVGMKSVLLDGVVIESDVMIGAGSLVPPGKVLTQYGLYVGSPVKRIRNLTCEEIDYLRYGAQNYVDLKDAYLAKLLG